MADAAALMAHGGAAIFHKSIARDMRDIEFFTNRPCLAYVQAGCEHFYGPDGEAFVVRAGDMLFMPRALYMVSDFVNAAGPLEAFLFFFDDRTIADFLPSIPQSGVHGASTHRPFVIQGSVPVVHFMDALRTIHSDGVASRDLLALKLRELLLLLATVGDAVRLRSFLTADATTCTRRNIKQVMRQHHQTNLTVADYAELSGRSLSSFKRDFQRQYGTTPGSWLREARLRKAYDQIVSSDETIASIASEVGYADTSHLIKAFKKQFGVTPKQARLEPDLGPHQLA
ncbi:MAG: AraC family transcriptional regulator [Pseudomonadota bacterium]